MFLSAASFGIALLVGHQGDAQFSSSAVIRDLSPSIVMLISGGRSLGPAALIDGSGLFVASRQIVGNGGIDARLNDGRVIRLVFVTEDRMAQLALLQGPAGTTYAP